METKSRALLDVKVFRKGGGEVFPPPFFEGRKRSERRDAEIAEKALE